MKIPESDSFARFVRWGIVLFIGYVLFKSSFGFLTPTHQPEKPVSAPIEVAETKKDCDKKIEFPFMAVNFIPEISPAIHIKDVKVGEGEPAICGQRAKISYIINNKEGKFLGKGNDETVGVGAFGGALPRGLELGLMGIKSGGHREITIPSELAFFYNNGVKENHYAKERAIIANVSLDSLSPELTKSPMELKIINDKFGAGKSVECGDKVTVGVKLWKIDGSKLYSNEKPLEFTVGNSPLFLGIDQAIIGMKKGGNRVVIIPPAYAKPLVHQFYDILISTPNNEIIVAEIELFSINDASQQNK